MFKGFLVLTTIATWTTAKPVKESSDEVTISEQLDPRYFMHQGAMFPNAIYNQPSNIYSQYPTLQLDNNSQRGVNFEFRCRCNAKVKNTTPKPVTVPQDANSQAQQQIQQLQEQLKQQAEQLRRQQQISSQGSGFEQFANLLSIADGLDCSCSGVAPHLNGNQQQTMLSQQGLVGTQSFLHPNMGGVPLTSPFNTPLISLQAVQSGPMFP